jgi:hypothetical protein
VDHPAAAQARQQLERLRVAVGAQGLELRKDVFMILAELVADIGGA